MAQRHTRPVRNRGGREPLRHSIRARIRGVRGVDRGPDLDFVPAEIVASGRPVPQFMTIHLVSPSDISFGTAVITPRWLYMLAAATPREYGDPRVIDETLDPIDFDTIAAGDVVGVGIHTFNALRGY